MSLRRWIGILAVAPIVLAGCGAGSEADAIAWTDDVCGALVGFATAASAQPQIDPADPVTAVQRLGAFLDSTAAAAQESIRGLKAAGPGPVAGGEEFVGKLTTNLTMIETSFSTAAEGLKRIDTSSQESLTAALPAVVGPLQELGKLADPADGLEGTAELRSAAEQAPMCKQLRSG